MGLTPPSDGYAMLNSHRVPDDLAKAQQSLGFCPQHDILWDELTVREHLIFYNGLKGVHPSQQEHEAVSSRTRLRRPTGSGDC